MKIGTIKRAEELIIYQLEFICHLNENSCLAPGIYFIVMKSILTVFLGWINLTDIQKIPFSMLYNVYLCSYFLFLWDCEYLFVVFLPWYRVLSTEFCVRISELPRIFSFFKVIFCLTFFHQNSYGQCEGYIRCFKYNEVEKCGIFSLLQFWKSSRHSFGTHNLKCSRANFNEEKPQFISGNKTQKLGGNMHWVKACSFYGDGIASTCSKYVQVHPSQQS